MNTLSLTQKVWNFCHTPRDDGVDYGEHALSRLPKIHHNWAGQHWRRPVLHELAEPEQTLMELRMASLLPAEVMHELAPITPQLDPIPPQLTALPPELVEKPGNPASLYTDWAQLSVAERQALMAAAQPIRGKKRVSPTLMEATVLDLCKGRYLGRRVLAFVLNRNADDLLQRTLNPLVTAGKLKTAFPSSSDPRQAYTTYRPE